MSTEPASYIPALAYRWLTPLYDPVVRWTTRERAFKTALLAQAGLKAGDRVLDLACGTATLTIAAKQACANAQIVGLDGDPQILELARAKAQAAGVDLQFELALSHQAPLADASTDVVLSSLFFHHIARDAKLATFREMHRVLRPGGRIHIADWGKAANPLMRALFYLIQLLDGFKTTADNVNGLLPEFMRRSGFVDVSETVRFATPLGTIALYAARKPASP
jgi:ubiquinone/menaquinone biosynthesis C-methylase UbiE